MTRWAARLGLLACAVAILTPLYFVQLTVHGGGVLTDGGDRVRLILAAADILLLFTLIVAGGLVVGLFCLLLGWLWRRAR